MPIYAALNLPFINEFAVDFIWPRIDQYLSMAGLPERTIPIAAERAIARYEAAERERAAEHEAALADLQRWKTGQAAARKMK